MKSKYLTIGGLSALSVTIIANFGFADVSSDRLDTYKANKLIPNEVQIATINSVSTDATGVAVFSPDALSWKSYSNASSAALGKFMDWTREDFEAFFADSANEAEFEDAWNALSQFGNDHVQEAAISDEDALSVLQAQFDSLISSYKLSGDAFPCEGLDFTGRTLMHMDLRNCTGITGEQIASASLVGDVKLPAVDFTGVDLTGKGFRQVDFSICTGLTAQQLLSVYTLQEAKIPAIDFSGADFSGGVDITGVDFSHCTGITVDQITSASGGYSQVILPSLDLSDVSLAGKNINDINFSNCTGLTWDQITSARYYTGIKLPSMDLTNADMSGNDLSFIDFTRCSGLTGSQLAKAREIYGIYVTSAQYEAIKSYLPSGKHIYVDGKFFTTP